MRLMTCTAAPQATTPAPPSSYSALHTLVAEYCDAHTVVAALSKQAEYVAEGAVVQSVLPHAADSHWRSGSSA